MSPLFEDRREAGRFLADQLARHEHESGVLVLALPRGGVPVGDEIARRLKAPLDVFVVRKLGVPGHEEFAFGALATGGVRFVNHRTTAALGMSEDQIEAIAARQKVELRRRERLYRGNRRPARIRGRKVILVDDGLATGSTMLAAVHALRGHHPASITVAVPVGAPESCARLRTEADNVFCGRSPEPFQSIGQWYQDFRQTTDKEVIETLRRNAHGQSQ